MKFKTLLFGLCIGLSSSLFANTVHLHPQANNTDNQSAAKAPTYAGYCDIEIINNSFYDVRVFGVFDDGSSLYPFNVYSWGAPETISLYYYGYCHSGMDLYINTLDGGYVYSGYTERGKTIIISPFLTNQIKADVKSR